MRTIYHAGGFLASSSSGNVAEVWDDTARTITTYDETGALIGARPYTASENAEADAALADAARAAVGAQLTADTTADLTKLRAAIDSLAVLLGDSTTAGSIRAWKAPITNNQNVTGSQAKALADLLLADAQATRRIARQTLRLARAMVGDYSTADVGAE